MKLRFSDQYHVILGQIIHGDEIIRTNVTMEVRKMEAALEGMREIYKKGRMERSDTKPDLHCVIEELYDLELLPFGWVLLKRVDKNAPDYIGIKYLGGLDPLVRIAELEAQLLAHNENEGDECPLCSLEAKNEKLSDDLLEYKEGMDVERIWKEEAYGRAGELRAELEDARNWARWAYRKGRQLETELDTERSMRHEAQSGYGNLMEKTEALEAEVWGFLKREARVLEIIDERGAIEAQVVEQAQTIQDGHERQAQLATKLHDVEAQVTKLRKFRCDWCGKSAGEGHGLHIVGAYATKKALDA